MKKIAILVFTWIMLISLKSLALAMMCHTGSGEHNEQPHEQKANSDQVDKPKVNIKESFIATVYTCPMHPEVREEKSGKCPKCGMKLEKKQVVMAYVCPEPGCEYQKASPGECPEHRKELVKAELKTHCPKCGEQINAEDLKLEPVKGGKVEKNK